MEVQKAASVDEYLSQFEGDVRLRLERMRAIIRQEAPDAEESISYAMPGYKLNGPLVYFAGFKNHVSLFGAGNMERFAEQLAGYKMSKGTVQFQNDEPLPEGLIRSIVKARVEENRAKAAKKGRKPVSM